MKTSPLTACWARSGSSSSLSSCRQSAAATDPSDTVAPPGSRCGSPASPAVADLVVASIHLASFTGIILGVSLCLACALNCCYKSRYYRQYAGDRQKLRGNQRADAAYAENYAERRVSARELAEEAPSPSRSSKL